MCYSAFALSGRAFPHTTCTQGGALGWELSAPSGRRLYLPFAITSLEGTPLEGAEIRALTDAKYKENVLSLYYKKHEGTVYYGCPYIYRFPVGGEDIDNSTFARVQLYVSGWETPRWIGDVKVYGSYDALTLFGTDRSVLYLDEESSFCNPENNVTLDACSTYIKTSGEIGVLTGTKSLMATEGDVVRFDIEVTSKGIYVREGKKVIVK